MQGDPHPVEPLALEVLHGTILGIEGVRVHAAAVNPIDWKVRAGHVKDWLNYKLPMIPGTSLKGKVRTLLSRQYGADQGQFSSEPKHDHEHKPRDH